MHPDCSLRKQNRSNSVHGVVWRDESPGNGEMVERAGVATNPHSLQGQNLAWSV